jgi:hypothetical protein
MALRRVATALLIAGMITARIAHAQVTLNFVNADIDKVAKAIGAATGKTIIVDPRAKGQWNLVAARRCKLIQRNNARRATASSVVNDYSGRPSTIVHAMRRSASLRYARRVAAGSCGDSHP